MTWGPSTSRGFPPKVRRIILGRDPVCRCDMNCPEHLGGPCSNASTEADHIVQPRNGGTQSPDNGRGLCKRCHVWHTSRQKRAHDRRQARPPEPHAGLK